MAQHLRGDCGDACLPRIAFDDQPEALAGQPLAMMVDEEGGFVGVMLDILLPCRVEVGL